MSIGSSCLFEGRWWWWRGTARIHRFQWGRIWNLSGRITLSRNFSHILKTEKHFRIISVHNRNGLLQKGDEWINITLHGLVWKNGIQQKLSVYCHVVASSLSSYQILLRNLRPFGVRAGRSSNDGSVVVINMENSLLSRQSIRRLSHSAPPFTNKTDTFHYVKLIRICWIRCVSGPTRLTMPFKRSFRTYLTA